MDWQTKNKYFMYFVKYATILLELKFQCMNTDWAFYVVPGLAGMELIFCIAACMVLCFGFVIKTVLITHQFWLLLTQCQVLLLPTLSPCLVVPPTPSRLGGGQEAGRTHTWDS